MATRPLTEECADHTELSGKVDLIEELDTLCDGSVDDTRRGELHEGSGGAFPERPMSYSRLANGLRQLASLGHEPVRTHSKEANG